MSYSRFNPLKRSAEPGATAPPGRSKRRGGGIAPEIALARAKREMSTANYGTIVQGFILKGVPETDIIPRENVFTYDAWKALGRHVRKGEHGVRITTMIPVGKRPEEAEETPQPGTRMRMWSTTVFHVTQTDPIEEPAAKPVRAS